MSEKNQGPPMAAFDTLCAGSLPERLEHELRQVFENIADENTEPDAVRKLIVTMTFKPNRDRDTSSVDVKFEKKLPGMTSAGGIVHLRIAAGKQVGIVDTPPEQGELFVPPALTSVPKGVAANG